MLVLLLMLLQLAVANIAIKEALPSCCFCYCCYFAADPAATTAAAIAAATVAIKATTFAVPIINAIATAIAAATVAIKATTFAVPTINAIGTAIAVAISFFCLTAIPAACCRADLFLLHATT